MAAVCSSFAVDQTAELDNLCRMDYIDGLITMPSEVCGVKKACLEQCS